MSDKGIEISVGANRGCGGCAIVFFFAFTIIYGYTMLDFVVDQVWYAVTGSLNSYLRVGALVSVGLIYPLPLAFFIALCIMGIVRIRNKNAILIVDQKGIYHRELVNKPIPWSEIRSIREEWYSGKHRTVAFVIEVDRLERFQSPPRWARFNWLHRLLPRRNYIQFRAVGLDISTEGLRTVLKSWMWVEPLH